MRYDSLVYVRSGISTSIYRLGHRCRRRCCCVKIYIIKDVYSLSVATVTHKNARYRDIGSENFFNKKLFHGYTTDLSLNGII